SYVTEADELNGAPRQATRKELYDFVESELCEVAGVSFDASGNIQQGQSLLPESNHYGRISREAALGLLSRLYLNAEVYTGTPQYRKCAQVSDYVISRHSGGYNGSGLAEDYLYLFCASNREYQNGANGGEILWAIPYEKDQIQSYGGTTFLIASAIANELGMSQTNYGLSAAWKCMHATLQFSNKFEDGDARDAMWVKGEQKVKKDELDENGNEQFETYNYIAENTEFSEWTNGYAVIKYTNLLKGDGNGSPADFAGTFWDQASFADGYASAFADTDLPLVRLAEMYLNYTESYIMGGGQAADMQKAIDYVNLVRGRSDNKAWGNGDLTADNILDERCREMYWELTRRSDLVRHHKFTGPNQAMWAWKGNTLTGTRISDRYDLMPIPSNTLAAQPYFRQNPGY
ncbi:MAG: RagB/SusD family nutrient uptake outer membrane protein, partial [Muribaculaceae bacterium]|nr:RagB/SusD family nutrient uptake outer membrane protein [Muribaculaceae bacterium]